MAKLVKNAFLQGISGKVGNVVFRPMPDGVTNVSSTPDFSSRKFSEGQVAHQARFKLATLYARDASKSEPIYARLAKGSGKSAYNFALSDWWEGPVIHSVERVDGGVRVRARDNVMVRRVEVRVVDAGGDVLVMGEASQVGADVWVFVSEVEGRVLVRVWDLAGNVVEGGTIGD